LLENISSQLGKIKKRKRDNDSSDEDASSSDATTTEDEDDPIDPEDEVTLMSKLPLKPSLDLHSDPPRRPSKSKNKHPYLPKPHRFVARLPRPGHKEKIKKKITFESLSMAEYTYGYLKAIAETENKTLKSTFTQHLTAIMKDASTYPWDRIITYETELYDELRRGNLTWRDELHIESIRLKHLVGSGMHFKANPQSSSSSKPAHAFTGNKTPSFNEPAEKYSKEGKFPCNAFQNGTCHVGGKGRHHEKSLHFCKFCFFAPHRQLACHHAEQNCHQKTKSPQ
jgi:hypothetical protein